MLDDTQMWHQQQQEHEQWLEMKERERDSKRDKEAEDSLNREYDIAFGSFANDFKRFVEGHEKDKAIVQPILNVHI